MINYYNQYIKYKNKYQKLKNMQKNYNFYFVHMTKNEKNLKNIIKSGYIKLGSDIPIKDKFLSGYVDEPYIFANIIFDDLENLDFFRNYTLILSPKIIEDYNVYFLGGWGNFNLTTISPSDTNNQKNQKINLIKQFISKPYDLPQIVLESPIIRQHEVRFDKSIDIKKYLIGIGIGHSDNPNDIDNYNNLEKIKKLLVKHGLTHIKIFNYNQIPKYHDFIIN